MIDEKPIRIRFNAVGSTLDERGRRLHAAGGGERRAWRGGGGGAGDQGGAEHDWSRLEGTSRASLAHRRVTAARRGTEGAGGQGRNAAGRSGAPARTGDDGRSDAAAALGVEEPREAGGGAARDGPSGERIDGSEAAATAGVSSTRQPQDEGWQQPSGP